MVVLTIAAPCLNKYLHTNGYYKFTTLKFSNNFIANANIPIHVEKLFDYDE